MKINFSRPLTVRLIKHYSGTTVSIDETESGGPTFDSAALCPQAIGYHWCLAFKVWMLKSLKLTIELN